jgi:prepilin-type N-terminal cleavage/methylation domain-containing protein
MRSHPTRREGFTLIELMITVAIIGILAAIAIPSFTSYQNRSRRAEAMTNVSAISKAEAAHFAASGVYHGTIPVPGGVLGAMKRLWDAASKAEFDPIGYQPEGAVYYDYDVNTVPGDCTCPPGQNGEALCYTISANGDIDGDGFIGSVVYFKRDPNGDSCSTAVTALPFVPDPGTGNPVYERPIVVPHDNPPLADDF